MAYTPSAFDLTRPIDTDIAETAQLEFRTMKAFYMGTVAKFGAFVGGIGAGGITNFSAPIPAGILGTNKTLRVRISGFINNTTGGATNVAWSMAYGAALFVAGSLITGVGGTYAYEIDVDITAAGATNAQITWAHSRVYDNNSGAGTTQNAIELAGCRNTMAIDSTVIQNLNFATQNASAINMTNSMDKALIIWQ